MKDRKRVSSRDVAKEAGVSQATVSYILNDVKNIRIKPETKAAVMDAIKKLNYHPNLIARGMKLKKSMSIGVVTDKNVTNFYFMKTLEGIRDGIQFHNYSITLLLNKSEDVSESEYIRYYNSNRIDGIIFAFAELDDLTVQYLNERNIPFVIVDSHATGKEVHEVCTDHLSQIPSVIEYFKAKGMGRIGYAGPIPNHIGESRLNAFREAVLKNGLILSEELIATSVFDDLEMFKAVTRLLRLRNTPQAILAGSPRFGMFAVKCALSLGIKVPEELSIIAFGSSNFYAVTHPALSAVELPLYDMGNRSAQMLLKILNGEEVAQTDILPSELVIRDSC